MRRVIFLTLSFVALLFATSPQASGYSVEPSFFSDLEEQCGLGPVPQAPCKSLLTLKAIRDSVCDRLYPDFIKSYRHLQESTQAVHTAEDELKALVNLIDTSLDPEKPITLSKGDSQYLVRVYALGTQNELRHLRMAKDLAKDRFDSKNELLANLPAKWATQDEYQEWFNTFYLQELYN